jgi:hypothetical protein
MKLENSKTLRSGLSPHASYFHTDSAKDLHAVIEFYDTASG